MRGNPHYEPNYEQYYQPYSYVYGPHTELEHTFHRVAKPLARVFEPALPLAAVGIPLGYMLYSGYHTYNDYKKEQAEAKAKAVREEEVQQRQADLLNNIADTHVQILEHAEASGASRRRQEDLLKQIASAQGQLIAHAGTSKEDRRHRNELLQKIADKQELLSNYLGPQQQLILDKQKKLGKRLKLLQEQTADVRTALSSMEERSSIHETEESADDYPRYDDSVSHESPRQPAIPPIVPLVEDAPREEHPLPKLSFKIPPVIRVPATVWSRKEPEYSVAGDIVNLIREIGLDATLKHPLLKKHKNYIPILVNPQRHVLEGRRLPRPFLDLLDDTTLAAYENAERENVKPKASTELAKEAKAAKARTAHVKRREKTGGGLFPIARSRINTRHFLSRLV